VAESQSKRCDISGTNLVADPSFELPLVADLPYRSLDRGDVIGPWSVSGPVDHISKDFWQAAHGGQSVDLDGCWMGGVAQVIRTTKGSAYDLCFALAANPDGGPDVKTLEVLWEKRRIAVLDFSSTGTSRTRMRWTYHHYEVVARTERSLLSFVSRTKGCYGPVIDDVQVVPKTMLLSRAELPLR
jgi:choice-of-anchor C domain-containing protein